MQLSQIAPKLRLGLVVTVLLAVPTFVVAQTAALRGRVTDESGSYIPSARVVLKAGDGQNKVTSATSDGSYSITGLVPGNYTISASAPALSMLPLSVSVIPGGQTIDLRLTIVPTNTQVNVDDVAGAVTTDSSSNASATVLKAEDLDALSDDPQDLQADLEALAGPAAGPGGNAFFVDGFSGGELPAKESIREVRINQNPFSPEYDKMGLGRVEIFTKPGSDKFHGNIGYNLGTDRWNSRNPYAEQKAPFLLQESENSFSGPITRRSSFTLNLERQAVDNGSVTNVVIVDPKSFAITPFTSALRTPQRHLRVGPHVDYQINDNNYVSLRYTMTRAEIQDAGIGSFDLISRGYHLLNTFNTFQAIETSIHGRSVNETRFQYFRQGNASTANTIAPEVQVLGSFNGGGASSLHNHDVQSSYELQNNTSIIAGPHAWRFGMRLRGQTEDSYLPQDFNGTFTFSGVLAPPLDANNQVVSGPLIQISSLEQYRRTLLGAAGGGASQFTIATGNPALSVHQFDSAFFGGDEWRLRPNITINLGIRYEFQTNIRAGKDFAPRIGIAWAPGAAGAKTPKTILRAGFGIFYDRFSLSNTLTGARYNGSVQQQYIIQNPAFFTTIPPISSLAGIPAASQAIREVDSHLRAPYLFQSAFTFERQLPWRSTLAVTYTNGHGLHQLRSEDVNVPLQGTFSGKGTGVYPYPGHGPIFLMTSSGLYNQNQLIANLTLKVNSAISLVNSYSLNRAMSNTDGLSTFPGNPYNYAGEYGPASTDIRHRLSVSGTINLRWALRFNPLVSYQSGSPYNITAGDDPYGTSLFTARPGLATDSTRPGLVRTALGLLDPRQNPLHADQIQATQNQSHTRL